MMKDTATNYLVKTRVGKEECEFINALQEKVFDKEMRKELNRLYSQKLLQDCREKLIRGDKKMEFDEQAQKLIDEFDDEHEITDIILLGKDGACRRLTYD